MFFFTSESIGNFTQKLRSLTKTSPSPSVSMDNIMAQIADPKKRAMAWTRALIARTQTMLLKKQENMDIVDQVIGEKKTALEYTLLFKAMEIGTPLQFSILQTFRSRSEDQYERCFDLSQEKWTSEVTQNLMNHAARIIQRHWKIVITCPCFAVCKRRLMYEYIHAHSFLKNSLH